MTDAMKKVMERVRKLLSLAGSNPNENEAMAAAMKAHAILAENNLTLADVEGGSAEEGFIVDKEIVTDSYPWRRQLANAVATLFFCKYFFQTVRDRKMSYDVHCFAGAEHNLVVCKLMFDYLHRTVDRLAKEGALKVPPSQRSPYRTSFRSACTIRLLMRIAERIEDAKRGKVKTATGNTLPALASMYDTISTQLTKFLDQKVGEFTPSKSKLALLHPDGLADGREAGDKIGLDTQIEREITAHLIEGKIIVTALELEKGGVGYRALLFELDAEHKPIGILNIKEANDPIEAMEAVCENFPAPTYAKKKDKLDSGDELSVFEVAMILFEEALA